VITEVLEIICRTIMLNNHFIFLLHSAVAEFRNGNHTVALLNFEAALAVEPDKPELLLGIGTICGLLGRDAKAATVLERALAVSGATPNLTQNLKMAHTRLGAERLARGEHAAAQHNFRRLAALDPFDIHAYDGLAKTCEDPAGALRSQCHAIALQPDRAAFYVHHGRLLKTAGHLQEAVTSYRRSLAVAPDDLWALSDLSEVLLMRGSIMAACSCSVRLAALVPDQMVGYSKLGLAVKSGNDVVAAWKAYDRGLRIDPENAALRYQRAEVMLQSGAWEEGWREYRWRWRRETPRPFPHPIWDGEDLLAGGKLLVWGEQGIGDEIMFAAGLRDLVRRGIPCVLECDPRLVSLFARSFPEIEIVAYRDRPAEALLDGGITAQIAIGDLPHRLSGARPYLKPDQTAVAGFRAKHGSPLTIGLSWWTAASTMRSIPLQALASALLASFPEKDAVRLVSLQYGAVAEELAEAVRQGLAVHDDDGLDRTNDIDGLAALVGAMDLVVSIDNSTLHMAGALGVPTWGLLPYAAEWRWMLGREDTPWYPAVRLFRQPWAGGWSAVLGRLSEALRQFPCRLS
jgi:tetratricopeptide (TPR) repeat protein